MATNFEFYKTKLLSSIFEGDFCIKRDGTIGICSETLCQECVLCEFAKNGSCNVEEALKWANAEHIEPPKLTKRERAFCESVQTGWIARDKNGDLYWFAEGFGVDKDQSIWNSEEYSKISSMGLCFCFVKWEDENPWRVEDLLKLDVVEEVQDDA